MVNRCMQLLSTVSDAILAVRLPDEGAISIQTSDLSFTLERHTPDRLKGLRIKSDNGNFVLPMDSDALVSQAANNSFVDAQVLMPIGHFTVACLLTSPLNGSARGWS